MSLQLKTWKAQIKDRLDIKYPNQIHDSRIRRRMKTQNLVVEELRFLRTWETTQVTSPLVPIAFLKTKFSTSNEDFIFN